MSFRLVAQLNRVYTGLLASVFNSNGEELSFTSRKSFDQWKTRNLKLDADKIFLGADRVDLTVRITDNNGDEANFIKGEKKLDFEGDEQTFSLQVSQARGSGRVKMKPKFVVAKEHPDNDTIDDDTNEDLSTTVAERDLTILDLKSQISKLQEKIPDSDELAERDSTILNLKSQISQLEEQLEVIDELSEADTFTQKDLAISERDKLITGQWDLQGVDLSGKDFMGGVINFRNAKLNGAKFNDSDLGGASFKASKLIGADFSSSSKNGTYLAVADFSGADLTDANLNNAWVHVGDFPRAKLKNAEMRGTTLSYARLADANFSGADLTNAELNNAYLAGTKFINATMNKVDLRNASPEGPYTLCPDDTRSLGWTKKGDKFPDFTGADLTEARIHNAEFAGANFTDADLTGAVGKPLFSRETIAKNWPRKETIWSNTICPDGSNSDFNTNCGYY